MLNKQTTHCVVADLFGTGIKYMIQIICRIIIIVLLYTVSIWIHTRVPGKKLLPHQQTGSHVVHQPQTPIVKCDPDLLTCFLCALVSFPVAQKPTLETEQEDQRFKAKLGRLGLKIK